MPRRKNDAVAKPCAFCGAPFETTRSDARFCRSACRIGFGNLMATRGKVLAPYVLAWIAGRGGGYRGTHPTAAKALSELTSIARGMIEEDKVANEGRGRPPVLDYMTSLFGEGFLHIDRKRS